MRKSCLKPGGAAVRFAFILAALASAHPALARQDGEPVAAGSTTKGGLVEGAQILHVTNLSDSGPGSLREAVETKGPRVIVFDVGGAISLAADLKLQKPYVTIAGQTAPSPGISLWGASLRVRTHDVVIQHIAVRAGPADTPAINDNRDAISIDGNPASPLDQQSFEVRLENVSASWSVDEALSIWYPTTHNVSVRHSIVSEALNNAGHPKGPHSMGLLIGQDTQAVSVTGDLMVSNMFRNPVVGKGASTYVANNFIANPGQNAIHFYDTGSTAPTRATIVNNVVEVGPDSKSTITGVLVPMGSDGTDAADQVFVDGNQLQLGLKGVQTRTGAGLTLEAQSPVSSVDWTLTPSDVVREDVLRYAGSRPADRNPTDRRLLDQIASGTERIVDAPPEEGDFKTVTNRLAAVPDDPMGQTSDGRTRLEDWLCEQHFAVGGAPSRDCPAKP